jgi:1-acyl-sn-glycerol-3-phosphate acyltransferase
MSLFCLLILLFLVHQSFAGLLFRNEEKRLRYFLKSVRFTSRLAMIILNVKVHRTGVKGEITQRLIVANHLSYLDVLVLFWDFPSLFVTSTEIRDTFLLGDICKLAGCFFVERRRDKRSMQTKELELKDMQKKFSMGFNIFLFPEGTSSDGRGVLPFKGTFFQLAVDSMTNVVPVCLKYTGENKDVFPWYGDMTFADHLYRVCLEERVEMRLTVLPEVALAEKMQLAKNCHQKIADAYV